MRVVLQRVRRASVTIDGSVVGQIGPGLLVLVGIHPRDGADDLCWMTEKIAGLRIFADDQGKMNCSVVDVGGSLLVVSQFTLYGDCRKGRRPGFTGAAPPAIAIPIYDDFLTRLRALGLPIATGQFGADMQVELVNDGPVTLIIDSPASTDASSS